MALFGKKSDAELERPVGATTDPFAGTSIHVIPEQFYGAATRPDVRLTMPVETQQPLAIVPTAPALAPVEPMVDEVLPEEQPKPRKRRWLLILLLLLILLAAGAAGAWWYFIGRISKPVPVPVVVGPQCGNGVCENGETVDLCNLDCKPVVVPTPVPTPVVVPVVPKPGADADNDGLTDVEERTVFGSDPNNVNTDHDNFVDLNEVLNLYDPSSKAPAPLDKNPGIATVEGANFKLLMPNIWQSTTADDGSKIFTAASGESLTVRVIAKPADESLKDWYVTTYAPTALAAVEILKNRRGLSYVVADDRLRAWVDLGSTVVGIKYDLAGAATIEYKNTFAMVVQSVAKKP